MSAPLRDPVVASVRLTELGHSLGFMLRLAQVKTFDQFYERLAQHGLKPGQFSVLWVVYENPGIRQGLVARTLRIKPAHMTTLVRRMEADRLIMRRIPDDDRRAVELTLTRAGRDFVAEHKAQFLGYWRKESGPLDADEMNQLLALLRKYVGLPEEPSA